MPLLTQQSSLLWESSLHSKLFLRRLVKGAVIKPLLLFCGSSGNYKLLFVIVLLKLLGRDFPSRFLTLIKTEESFEGS